MVCQLYGVSMSWRCTDRLCGASGTAPDRICSSVTPRVGSLRKPGSLSFWYELKITRWPFQSC